MVAEVCFRLDLLAMAGDTATPPAGLHPLF